MKHAPFFGLILLMLNACNALPPAGMDPSPTVFPPTAGETSTLPAALPEPTPTVPATVTATTLAGDPADLAVIQAFNPVERLNGIKVTLNTSDFNATNIKVNEYRINGALYTLDAATHQMIEYEAGFIALMPTGPAQTYTRDQLKNMAVALIKAQTAGVDLSRLVFETGGKVQSAYFRWSKIAPGQPGYAAFIQVVYGEDGRLLGYINALAATPLNPPPGGG
jgi:hypothetical protein